MLTGYNIEEYRVLIDKVTEHINFCNRFIEYISSNNADDYNHAVKCLSELMTSDSSWKEFKRAVLAFDEKTICMSNEEE